MKNNLYFIIYLHDTRMNAMFHLNMFHMIYLDLYIIEAYFSKKFINEHYTWHTRIIYLLSYVQK